MTRVLLLCSVDRKGNLDALQKKPLGGLDFRALAKELAAEGAAFASTDLAAQRAALVSQGVALPSDHLVLVLGGSNGILRHVALQLVFAEQVSTFIVHKDSKKLQIGPFHVEALKAAADASGVFVDSTNDDATDPNVLTGVVEKLASRARVVHVLNGIAAGAPKRSPAFGPTEVIDLDVGFHSLSQTADFNAIRSIGLVPVEVASAEDEARTMRAMGTSTLVWAEALSRAGLLVPNESIVAFADYDFSDDDPVYGKGPLATAKKRQRESMNEIAGRFSARTCRIAYPAMNTTALSAIPGGLFGFAVSAEVLLCENEFQDMATLAARTMRVFGEAPRELRLDEAYQRRLGEMRVLAATIDQATLATAFPQLCSASAKRLI